MEFYAQSTLHAFQVLQLQLNRQDSPAGSDPREVADSAGRTPLHYASARRDLALLLSPSFHPSSLAAGSGGAAAVGPESEPEGPLSLSEVAGRAVKKFLRCVTCQFSTALSTLGVIDSHCQCHNLAIAFHTIRDQLDALVVVEQEGVELGRRGSSLHRQPSAYSRQTTTPRRHPSGRLLLNRQHSHLKAEGITLPRSPRQLTGIQCNPLFSPSMDDLHDERGGTAATQGGTTTAPETPLGGSPLRRMVGEV